MKKNITETSTEQMEKKEQDPLSHQVETNDKREEAAWGIHTDKAAFGRKRIVIPDRW